MDYGQVDELCFWMSFGPWLLVLCGAIISGNGPTPIEVRRDHPDPGWSANTLQGWDVIVAS